jgi:multidrug efflux pump subunit AcrB
MWIVRLALRRPYTFVVAAILVLVLGILSIFKMPTDIFPVVDIPVVSVIWQYAGMSPDDMEKRIIFPYERVLTTTVNDIEHIESQSLAGTGVVKIYFQPNAKIEQGVAQVTAISQTILRQFPTGTQPPLIIQYSASNVPIIQLSLSSETMPEQLMFDTAVNFMRPQLVTIPGVQIPYPYGGKQRQILVDLNPEALTAYGLSPADVSNAINNQSLILPSGSAKIGKQEYQVILNASPLVVSELNDLPIKTVPQGDGSQKTVFIKDVAHVRDGFQVQTNLVHVDGSRGVVITILKNGNASTLDVVDAVKAKLPELEASLPPNAKDLKITPIFDQSLFVRASISGVIHEAAIAAGLTALMILLFLGSWRSTLIVVVSIPLSILVSIIILGFLGQTLNVMTLGGMALAVGILVDDATVEIENIHRNLHMRKKLIQSILDGASQIAVPAFVSTLCICIVFVPVVFISGAAKFLFTPLAMAVVFAMMTSYLLSRTLTPTMVHFLLAAEVEMYGGEHDPEDPVDHVGQPKSKPFFQRTGTRIAMMTVVALIVVAAGVLSSRAGNAVPYLSGPVRATPAWIRANWQLSAILFLSLVTFTFFCWAAGKYSLIWRVHAKFNSAFEFCRAIYGRVLAWALLHRGPTVAAFVTVALGSMFLLMFIGQDFFPTVDAGQMRLHVRAPAGTRLEQSERYFAAVQDIIRRDIPADEVKVSLDNIGIPNSGINLSLSDGSVNASAEGEVLVALNEGHAPTERYIKQIRKDVARELPELTLWAAPADIVTQVLNFGLPASIDVQVAGMNAKGNRDLMMRMAPELAAVPGAVDARMQQVSLTPDIHINVDRTLASQLGVLQKDVASDVLISLSGSFQTAPNFFLAPDNNVSYNILVQTPQYRVDTIQDLANTPIVPTAVPGTPSNAQLLGNMAKVVRGNSATNLTHYDIKPTYDLLLGTQDADLGSVSRGVQAVVDKYASKLPKGSKFVLRGQVQSMNDSFKGLAVGLIFAVMLVYLLMVVNFQSWLDPLIIIMAVPGAAAGILWMLWATGTTISVPALMGAMMTVGVATANSILMITFANDQRKDHNLDAHDAALSAGMTRLRPVIMTATAMIIGMLPMSLGLGEGGEQNAPLGRAVIGGLLMATLYTLIFVPVVYSLLRTKQPHSIVSKELQ